MDGSAFAKLSPEIRNLIYQYTFSSNFKVTFRHNSNIQHALTMTCNQIRHECLAMWYTSTRYNAHLRDGPVTPLIHWLSTIGREACLLVSEITLWDMHDNVLTLLSPAYLDHYLNAESADGITRTVSEEYSLPEANALPSAQRLRLWKAIDELGLGLRQVKEQYDGSCLIHSTSAYVMMDRSKS